MTKPTITPTAKSKEAKPTSDKVASTPIDDASQHPTTMQAAPEPMPPENKGIKAYAKLPIWQVAIVLLVSVVLISCFKHDRLANYWQQTYQQTTIWSALNTLPLWAQGIRTEQALNTDGFTQRLKVMSSQSNDYLNQTFYADEIERRRQLKIAEAKRIAAAKEAARLEALRRERERLIIKEVKISPSQKVFFAGDSMMQGVAPWAMRELQNDHQVASIDLSKQSTGLSYSSFFDWPATVEDTITNHPDIGVLVMFLGANDPWAVPDPDNAGAPYIDFATPKWTALYRQKIDRIMKAAQDNQVQVIWMTPPTMKSDTLREEMAVLTKIYHDAIPNTQALLIDSKPLLHDNASGDAYTDSILLDGKQVKVRTADGIHFTVAGQKRLAKEIVSHIKVISDTPE